MIPASTSTAPNIWKAVRRSSNHHQPIAAAPIVQPLSGVGAVPRYGRYLSHDGQYEVVATFDLEAEIARLDRLPHRMTADRAAAKLFTGELDLVTVASAYPALYEKHTKRFEDALAKRLAHRDRVAQNRAAADRDRIAAEEQRVEELHGDAIAAAARDAPVAGVALATLARDRGAFPGRADHAPDLGWDRSGRVLG